MNWYVVTADFKSYRVMLLTTAQANSGGIGSLSVAAGPFTTKNAAQKKATKLSGGASAPIGGKTNDPNLHWWVLVPHGTDQGGTFDPTQLWPVAIIVSFTKGSKQDQALLTGDPGTIIYQGKKWDRWMGPFDSKPKHGGPNPPKAPQPLAGLESIGHFFSNISQREFWIRVAEGALGIALILVAGGHLVSNTKMGKSIIKSTSPVSRALQLGGVAKSTGSKAASAAISGKAGASAASVAKAAKEVAPVKPPAVKPAPSGSIRSMTGT